MPMKNRPPDNQRPPDNRRRHQQKPPPPPQNHGQHRNNGNNGNHGNQPRGRRHHNGGRRGCYVATACYGSYNAPEVLVLRHFRDNTLENSIFGRLFVDLYYFVSPFLANKLKNFKTLNKFIRTKILDKIVEKVTK